jgi:hypothetical protein
MSMLRKLRAIVSVGVVWGLAWIPLAIGSVTFLSVVGGRWPPLSLLTEAGLIGALTGGASGAIFGGLLAATERRRTVASLSTRRVVLLGVLAGIVPAGLMALGAALRVHDAGAVIGPLLARVVTVTSLLGAACAGGILAVVRRAAPLPGEPRRQVLSDRSSPPPTV